MTEPKDRSGFAYLFRSASGMYKIGCSRNPQARMQDLDVGPEPLVLVHMIATDHARWLEHRLHKRFAPRRIRGEWFALTPRDLAKIQAVDRCDRPKLLRKQKEGRPSKKMARRGLGSYPSRRREASGAPEANPIGRRLRVLREASGLSQAALATKARSLGEPISPGAVNDLEAGRRPDPLASTIRALALALDVSANELLGLPTRPGPPFADSVG